MHSWSHQPPQLVSPATTAGLTSHHSWSHQPQLVSLATAGFTSHHSWSHKLQQLVSPATTAGITSHHSWSHQPPQLVSPATTAGLTSYHSWAHQPPQLVSPATTAGIDPCCCVLWDTRASGPITVMASLIDWTQPSLPTLCLCYHTGSPYLWHVQTRSYMSQNLTLSKNRKFYVNLSTNSKSAGEMMMAISRRVTADCISMDSFDWSMPSMSCPFISTWFMLSRKLFRCC